MEETIRANEIIGTVQVVILKVLLILKQPTADSKCEERKENLL